LTSCRDIASVNSASARFVDANPSSRSSLSASDAGRTFWRSRSDEAIWSNIARNDGIAVVGLRAPGRPRGVERGLPALTQTEQLAALTSLRAIPGIEMLEGSDHLPILRLRISTREALQQVRLLPFVDYLEPEMDFEVPVRGLWHSACSNSGWQGSMTTIEPGDILPGNYSLMSIPNAWTRSSGAGITIGLVDTGIDPVQPQLNNQFTDGLSTGRTITRTYRTGSDFFDHCGHGTHMASVLVAPRDGRNTLGVAWRANLFAVRVNGDVWLDGTNVTATRLGIADAAQVSQIIVLAFGSSNPWQSVADEIAYWYYNFDRLFVGAAGTGAPWLGVLFPASEVTVTAVSGTDCPDCHYGSKVDFVAPQGQPATGAVYLGHPDLGVSSRSSNATAVIAGVAALVWARDPSRSRFGVLSLLAHSASPTGARSWTTGWGVPNAFCAVGGWCMQWVDGPSLIEETGTYTFTARHTIGDGPFTYLWDSGETTQSKERFVQITYATQEHTFQEWVTITDQSTGESRRVARDVTVRQPNGCSTCW
jgi:serine protease